jgi:hypothetical protein
MQHNNSKDGFDKTFLKVKGIDMATINVAASFDVNLALRLMFHYKIDLIAMQEPFAWGSKVSEETKQRIQRTCNQWGMQAQIAGLQVIIMDKTLAASHRKCTIKLDGRIISNVFDNGDGTTTTIIYVYRKPHGRKTKRKAQDEETKMMIVIQKTLLEEITNSYAINPNNIVFVEGDGVQCTPAVRLLILRKYSVASL